MNTPSQSARLLLSFAFAVVSAGAAADSATNTRAVGGSRAQTEALRTGPMSAAERAQLVSAIVRRWSGYVRHSYGTEPRVWAQSMAGTFAAADPMNLRRAERMGTYEGMVSLLVGQRTTDASIINQLAKSDPVTAASLGSPANDLVYTMISPCRIVDTRIAGGVIAGNATRDLHSHNAGGNFAPQGGLSTGDCGIPESPSAVVMNVTVVGPGSPGFLTIFPYNTPRPTASSVNYVGGSVVGNEVIVRQTLGQEFDFSIFSLAETHVVVDVSGYFMAPIQTAVECVTPFVTMPVPAQGFAGVTASCPSGYAATGGGCFVPPNGILASFSVTVSGPDSGYKCDISNATVNILQASAQARCCRIPGRAPL